MFVKASLSSQPSSFIIHREWSKGAGGEDTDPKLGTNYTYIQCTIKMNALIFIFVFLPNLSSVIVKIWMCKKIRDE